jgi:hypothetical protein
LVALEANAEDGQLQVRDALMSFCCCFVDCLVLRL